MSAVKIEGPWKPMPPVYERHDGVRIHTFGLIRSPDGEISQPPHSELRKLLSLTGNNRRRALMKLAELKYPLGNDHG